MLNMASEIREIGHKFSPTTPDFPKAYLGHCLKYLNKILGLCLNIVDKYMDKFSEESEVEGGWVWLI